MHMTTQQTFTADLARMNTKFEALGAVQAYDDGFMAIDPTKAPAALLSAYQGLVSYGYANGLL